MVFKAKREALILFVGDILALTVALWLSLAVRSFSLPDFRTVYTHAKPFVIIVAVWLLVFFIFDLYGKQTTFFRRKLPGIIIKAQVLNSVVAIIFFYFIPYFSITPKTILFFNLFFSTILIYLWRKHLWTILPRGRAEYAVILSDKPEGDMLARELSLNDKYGVKLLGPEVFGTAEAKKISFVILDLSDSRYEKALRNFYHMLVKGVRFIDIAEFYEEVFDKVPLSYVDERWFLENISNRPKPVYDSLKRMFDVTAASILWLAALPLYPLIYLAVKMNDGGEIFISQERLGKNNRTFFIKKFRSMKDGAVTKAGNFLRKTRMDELPQLTSIIKGDLALIGPRPEMPHYAELYRKEIPYYEARHMISPGLSGWAQLYHENHPHFAPALEETKEKLSYDLYYVKNRSFWLDIKITLKTIKTILLRTGI